MNKSRLLLVVSLFLVSALAFLPLIWRIGYMNDDWYLMYSAGAYGSKAFIDIFSVDRPLRAPVMMAAYALFGEVPLYYNLSAYVFRLISALALLWVLWMLWPGQRQFAFLSSLLYLIYPGFLSQINGIDYQSQMISLAAALLSLALTVHVLREKRPVYKLTATFLAIVLGILYLGLVEYEIGFEWIRILFLFVLVGNTAWGFLSRITATIKAWLPYSLIIIGFGGWRLFLFKSERGATDIDLQFSQFRSYPIQTMYHWATQVARDLIDVTFSAWATPLSQLIHHIQYWGILLAVFTTIVALYASRMEEIQTEARDTVFSREALWVGILAAIGGLIPIAMVNRDVSFPFFSRYSLVSSVGVAIFINAVLLKLKVGWLRHGLTVLLVFSVILMHHANSMKAVQQTALTQDFWWQVSWRVPQFEKNTTLIATYPGVALEEDYFIWGPANLIYYPEKQTDKEIQPGIFAAILSSDTVNKVLTRERQVYDNRKTIITYANYRNVLVLTKPSVDSCVHVLDGSQPEFSPGELDSVRVIGPYSEIEHVLVDETHHAPPEVVFGPEPAHTWCYYYEKATYEHQLGNWEAVLEVGEQAFDQGFAPADPIEWLPFLQAYARTGNIERLQVMKEKMKKADPFVFQQACNSLTSISGLSDKVSETINSLYCTKN